MLFRKIWDEKSTCLQTKNPLSIHISEVKRTNLSKLYKNAKNACYFITFKIFPALYESSGIMWQVLVICQVGCVEEVWQLEAVVCGGILRFMNNVSWKESFGLEKLGYSSLLYGWKFNFKKCCLALRLGNFSFSTNSFVCLPNFPISWQDILYFGKCWGIS